MIFMARVKKDAESLKDEFLKPETLLKERYVIENLISTSYVSRMYKAKDKEFNSEVAIKELLVDGFLNIAERDQAVKQFHIESQLLLKLSHENLPKFEDYFEFNERKYLVMEYVSGDKLSDIIKNSQDFLPESRVIKWALNLCDILYYLHTIKPNPIIFRGLCPENVIITSDGKLKLIDFGISKIFDPQAKTLAVAKTAKMYYSPMEQYTAQTDDRTDIYSLGATLYFLMTRTPPVDAIDRTLNELPLPLCRKFNSSITSEFENIIFKAMELNPDRRYANIVSMRSAIEALTIEEKKPSVSEKIEEKLLEKSEEVIEKETDEKKEPSISVLESILVFLIDFLQNLRKKIRKQE